MKGKIFNEETGKWISGGAAQLHLIKKGGGFNNFVSGIAKEAAREAVKEVLDEMASREIRSSRPNLRRVK